MTKDQLQDIANRALYRSVNTNPPMRLNQCLIEEGWKAGLEAVKGEMNKMDGHSSITDWCRLKQWLDDQAR